MMHTGVDGSTCIFERKLVIAKLDLFKLNLPVSFATKRNIVNVSCVVSGIDASKDNLSAICIAVPHAEGEDRLFKKLLVYHAVERRRDVVY